MIYQDKDKQYEFPLISHEIEAAVIDQRAYDGYINATALCKACDKLFADYRRLKVTEEFLQELISDIGIPISEIVQVVKGGIPELQGTWVQPQITINLGLNGLHLNLQWLYQSGFLNGWL